jgi:4-amino-4-deoxy-L-arabinose transferase-like glycosyltransferase
MLNPPSPCPEQTRQLRPWLLALLLLTALVKLAYVFGGTHYASYVMSDSAHYLNRARHFLEGGLPTRVDWDIYPLGASVLLAGYWWALGLVGLGGHGLETALLLNIAAGTAMVWMVWRMALHVTGQPRLALATAAVYGLFYPLVYLNAFALSEGPAQLFFMAALLLLIEAPALARHATAALMAAGLLLALAAHCRGNFILSLPLAVAVVLWQPPAGRSRLRAALALMLPALAVFATAALALDWLSEGVTAKATGNNGGFNFFMQQCHYHGAISVSADYTWAFYPPVYVDHPELGVFRSSVPFPDQGFYFREGLRCLWRQPDGWMRLLAFGPSMVYGSFFPTWHDALGFDAGMALSRHGLFVLLLLMPAGVAAGWRRARQATVLLLSQMLMLWLTFALFSADHRHLYSIAFAFFVFGALGATTVWRRTRLERWMWLGETAFLAAGLYALFAPQGLLGLHQRRPLSIAASALSTPVEDGTPWTSLDAFRFWAPLDIALGSVRHNTALSLALDHNDRYELSFWDGPQRLGRVELALAGDPPPPEGLINRHLRIPAAVAARGYDRLQLTPLSGDDRYAVAGLRLE